MLETLELPVDLFVGLEQHLYELTMAGRHEEATAYLDEKFSAISFHGYTYTRQVYIETLQKMTTVHSAVLGPIQVVREGDQAIVTGIVDIDWSRGGLRVSGPVRFTKVWVKRTAGWRILHLHASDARLSQAWPQASRKMTYP